MTMWYSVEGRMKFYRTSLDLVEVKTLLDDEEFCLIQGQEDLPNDIVGLHIGFNDSIPNVSEGEINTLITEAGYYASEPGYLRFVSDDDRGRIYFGTPEKIAEFQRKSRVKRAKRLLKDLSKEELAEVLDSLEKR